jgi:hypothetical protein
VRVGDPARESRKRLAGAHRGRQLRVGGRATGGHPAGDFSFGQREIHPPDPGDLACGQHRRHTGALGVVHGDESVAAERAARGDGQFQTGGEAVSQAHRIACDGAFGAGDGSPLIVEPGHGGRLDAVGAVDRDDTPTGPIRDPAPQVGADISDELSHFACGGTQFPGTGEPVPGQPPDSRGLVHAHHRRPGLPQRVGDGEQERSRPGDDNAFADGNAFAFGHGLRRAGGHHAGQGPARNGKGAIMSPGRQDQGPGGDRLATSIGPVDEAAHDIDAHAVVAAFDRPDVGAQIQR